MPVETGASPSFKNRFLGGLNAGAAAMGSPTAGMTSGLARERFRPQVMPQRAMAGGMPSGGADMPIVKGPSGFRFGQNPDGIPSNTGITGGMFHGGMSSMFPSAFRPAPYQVNTGNMVNNQGMGQPMGQGMPVPGLWRTYQNMFGGGAQRPVFG